MSFAGACRPLAILLLCASACARPPAPGVLTLAPAGMRLSGTYTPHPDGTLTMAPDSSAESEVYVDAGTVTLTVTAATSAATHPMSIELWFAGTSVGRQRVQSTERAALAFQGRSRTSGPFTIRLVARDDGSAGDAAVLVVEKVVVTQP